MRKFAILALAAVFIIPAALAAGRPEFHDVAGHWAEEHLVKMIEADILRGDGTGNALPNQPIRWHEVDIMLARVFGADPVYPDSGRNREIARHEAITAAVGSFDLPPVPLSFTSRFSDFSSVPEGSRASVLVMEAAGILVGKDGKIAPYDTFTRAEFITMVSRITGVIIDNDTNFNNAEVARAFIRYPGLTVTGLTAEFLTVAQGVSDTTFANCDIGTLYLRGGEGSVDLAGSYVTEMQINTALPGNIHVTVDGSSITELVKIVHPGAVIGGTGTVVRMEKHYD
jgi:hypothetical protein